MTIRRLSIAPMLDWTDRYFRYFARLITKRTLLYSEMITTGAIIHGDANRFLAFDNSEYPVAIQLGGNSPDDLATCAAIAEKHGYDEVNFNVGCPSDRVQAGQFGASLMAEPDLVAECISAMKSVVTIPVTMKTRIGIDNHDSYEALTHLVSKVADTGCDAFIIHARKAWLSGLSPKENREIPPLRYDVVEQLKTDFPHLEICINGGITSLDKSLSLLESLDGVMIGRQAYHDPWMLADADERIYGEKKNNASRHDIIERFLPFVESELSQGIYLNHITRHILGLFQGQPGARAWRRYISENAHLKNAGPEVIVKAASLVS